MKSLPSEHRERLIETKIEELNLQRYRDVLSGTLSGGNKRKLSVACAIIGDPKIVFLDEPSTGMDPQARRFMWRVISNIATVRKQSTIILTTHSMEEAEALSTRLGIMVRGNFRCLGTPQHIKHKYGEGYELEVKMFEPSAEKILSRTKQTNFAPCIITLTQSMNSIGSNYTKSSQSCVRTSRLLRRFLSEAQETIFCCESRSKSMLDCRAWLSSCAWKRQENIYSDS